ncbi:MAG TPA: F0F1 ATP synthase subunit delta [Candidatus Paceibacterota bacterium]
MKYPAQNYARAYMELGATPVHSKKLFSIMKKNCDISQINKVVNEIEKLQARKIGGHIVEVEFARAQDSKSREKVLSRFSPKDRIITKVKPDLIVGMRVIRDGEFELDMSLSGKLEKLFA